uniref:NTF2-like domain-containing protein n=1 Tax=Davidia involucrata TaxID=16924 RepID=A0A5B6ZH78_DAVIN
MAFLLPNLSPTLLLQSKDKPIIHHTLLSPLPTTTNPTSILSPLTKLEPPPFRVAQVNQTPGSQDKQQRNDFYLNLGLAVRTLREDLPLLFTKDLNYDIYRDDITFLDPLNTFTGIEKYKLIFWALRFHGKILFREISLEVFRVWQPSENVILIRWNLRGVPRVPWEAKGQFQGTSRYKLDRNGKIYEHRVDNLAFNFPQRLKPAASVLDLVAACPASPNPTFLWGPPDVYSSSSSSWVEFYRAVRETLDHEGYLIPQDCLATCS